MSGSSIASEIKRKSGKQVLDWSRVTVISVAVVLAQPVQPKKRCRPLGVARKVVLRLVLGMKRTKHCDLPPEPQSILGAVTTPPVRWERMFKVSPPLKEISIVSVPTVYAGRSGWTCAYKALERRAAMGMGKVWLDE